MSRRVYWRLKDMKAAIEEIKRLLDPNSRNVLNTDPAVRAAFERFLEILSEASRHVPEELRQKHPQIPWRQVADLGNVIRHIYHKIDLDVLWSTYENDLPELETVVDSLLTEVGPPDTQTHG